MFYSLGYTVEYGVHQNQEKDFGGFEVVRVNGKVQHWYLETYVCDNPLDLKNMQICRFFFAGGQLFENISKKIQNV